MHSPGSKSYKALYLLELSCVGTCGGGDGVVTFDIPPPLPVLILSPSSYLGVNLGLSLCGLLAASDNLTT